MRINKPTTSLKTGILLLILTLVSSQVAAFSHIHELDIHEHHEVHEHAELYEHLGFHEHDDVHEHAGLIDHEFHFECGLCVVLLGGLALGSLLGSSTKCFASLTSRLDFTDLKTTQSYKRPPATGPPSPFS